MMEAKVEAKKFLVILGAVALVGCGLLIALPKRQPEIRTEPVSNNVGPEDAWMACALFVDRSGGPSYLKADDGPLNPLPIPTLEDGFWWAGVYYPKTEQVFACKMTESGGDFTLVAVTEA